MTSAAAPFKGKSSLARGGRAARPFAPEERGAAGILERLQAPVFTRPAYVVYPTGPLQPETVEPALAALREVAALEGGG